MADAHQAAQGGSQRLRAGNVGEVKKPRQKRLLLPDRLLPGALYSWTEIETFVRISRETWRIRVIDGTAPPKVRTGERGVKYRGAEVLRWIDDPAGYQAPKARP